MPDRIRRKGQRAAHGLPKPILVALDRMKAIVEGKMPDPRPKV